MNYVITPTLEHIALVRIAVALWNQRDIWDSVAGFSFQSNYGGTLQRWLKIESKAIEKVQQLLQPGCFKEKILGFIKPIGFEIFKWLEYHCNGSYICVHLPSELCWSPQGTVDRKKTAQMLIRDETIDITTRYKLACVYCLEEDVPILWNKFPNDRRDSLSYENCSLHESKLRDIVLLWTFLTKRGQTFRRHMSFQHAFRLSAEDTNNRVATEYFFQKLTPTEKQECLVKTAKYVLDARVLCFLLSQMNEKQQLQVFKSDTFKVLECFLQWPLQCYFMETANRMLDFLDKKICHILLERISEKVAKGYKDFDYQKIFGEFWQKISHAHKRYIIDQVLGDSCWCLMTKLFAAKDKMNIKLIFQYATLCEKKRFLFGERGVYIFTRLVNCCDWDFVEFFVGECITSKEELRKFKEIFVEDMTESHFKEVVDKEKLDKASLLLENIDFAYDKDKCIEGESSHEI